MTSLKSWTVLLAVWLLLPGMLSNSEVRALNLTLTRNNFHSTTPEPEVVTGPEVVTVFHVAQRTKMKCCDGYQWAGGSCKPYCEHSCENGVCIRPNVCECKPGYQMLNDTNGKESCQPLCTNGCFNGNCVAPDVCTCDEGYWLDSDGYNCRPVCDEKCERQTGGYCSEPNVCSCHTGYRKNETSHTCEPVCHDSCILGLCLAPNTCGCAAGYRLDLYSELLDCKPICNETCVFGSCTKPGICTCDDGYRPVNATVCEPNCTNCDNGRCTAPGVCTCNVGFSFDTWDGKCVPKCDEPCEYNAECVSFNTCNCSVGYRRVHYNESVYYTQLKSYLSKLRRDDYICEPVCDFNCTNGKCLAPNTCYCDRTYYPSTIRLLSGKSSSFENNITLCKPCADVPCGTTKDMACIGEDITACSCENGYENKNGRCVPVCAQKCLNGRCTEPNLCTCDNGFAPRNESVCVPICEDGCRNGDCVAPNRCVCRDGFVLNAGYSFSREKCIPACDRNCSGHATCAVDNNGYSCECDFGWTGADCDQPTMCVATGFDRRRIDGIAIRNDTNSTIVRAHENAPRCHRCGEFLNNASLCYTVSSDGNDTTTPTVGCLLSTDLSCYDASSTKVAKNGRTWHLLIAATVVLIAIGSTIAAYCVYRKYQRTKLATGNSASYLAPNSFATESLLGESVIYL